MSSSITSGLSSETSLIASTPVEASPAISKPSCEAIIWRSRARAGASSSTIRIRIAAILFHQFARDFQADLRPLNAALPCKLRAVAIITRDPVGHISQSMTTVTNRKTGRKSRAVVRYLDTQQIALKRHVHAHHPRAFERRNAMFDRVLD